jgi:hypothetical protein
VSREEATDGIHKRAPPRTLPNQQTFTRAKWQVKKWDSGSMNSRSSLIFAVGQNGPETAVPPKLPRKPGLSH